MNANIFWLALNVAAVTMTGVSLLSPCSEMPRILTIALFGLNCAYTPFFFRKALRPNTEAQACREAASAGMRC